MGISIGANTLVKYAGEEGEKSLIKAGVSIANPWDIHECADHMSKFTKYIYDQQLLKGFKRLLTKNRDQMEKHPEIQLDIGRVFKLLLEF
jgi:predicted alpha/beta-fold hydrolase